MTTTIDQKIAWSIGKLTSLHQQDRNSFNTIMQEFKAQYSITSRDMVTLIHLFGLYSKHIFRHENTNLRITLWDDEYVDTLNTREIEYLRDIMSYQVNYFRGVNGSNRLAVSCTWIADL